MMRFEYNPEVKILLKDYSDKKVKMEYIEDSWSMPKSSKRPPSFKDPKYGWNFPLI
ncbi:hypothetical protein [Bacillus sp. PS06]|uniref:hypothetical protein n=1 Tax=Bacillus sp. PS06 TaxID=2764176 RepID=UPI0017851045|nr:hypothetical protein [Bacillus sp. PS06]MBD8068717.1 hypothetical protein [Bacillus sp. PS06]